MSNYKDIVGISLLMGPGDNKQLAADLEREILNGGMDALEEEENETLNYAKEMNRMTKELSLDVNNGGLDSYEDRDRGGNNSGNEYEDSGSDRGSDKYHPNNIEDDQLKFMTQEQKKTNYVNSAFKDIDNDDALEFDIDKERDEDEKHQLLEQIDTLRDTLDDDGINLSNVPSVTKDNTISDIRNIHKILRLKNDKNRYCSFAEELFLSGAYGLEYLFDGKNDWFGRKPDLVGWSNTVRIKLRRCRFQTSTLIKDMMQDYNLGPGLQLALELLPSMFLYSRQKKLANKDSISEDIEYSNALSNLNDQ